MPFCGSEISNNLLVRTHVSTNPIYGEIKVLKQLTNLDASARVFRMVALLIDVPSRDSATLRELIAWTFYCRATMESLIEF